MKTTEYIRFLTEQDKARIYFKRNRGEISHFIIQYYALINERWVTIIRVDTCHGYAHKHIYHKGGREYCFKLHGELNEIFTQNVNMVLKHFEKLKQNYLQTK